MELAISSATRTMCHAGANTKQAKFRLLIRLGPQLQLTGLA
jgi:hypothetical protein